jgi:large subunit ribosomal protein L30
MMADVRITQTRSTIGTSKRHRAALQSLGLRGINKSVIRPKSDSLDGQLRLVAHLVRVDDAKPAGKE